MKEKKSQGITSIMIFLTVVLIIGMVVLTVIFSQVSEQTSSTPIADDTFTASNTTCVAVTDSCIVTGTGTFVNATVTTVINPATFTECDTLSRGANKVDGYFIVAGGDALRINGAGVNASYTEESCAAISGGITRLVMDNYAVLFAIALLVVVAGFVIIGRK